MLYFKEEKALNFEGYNLWIINKGKNMKKLLLASALLAATLTMANENKFEISPMIGYDFTEDSLNIKDSSYPLVGLEIQANSPNSKISPEFSLLYSQDVDYESGQDTKIIRGAFNGVYTFDETFSVTPFAKLGAGVEAISNENSQNSDGFFLNAGAGAKIPFTDSLALKLEALYMAKLASDNSGKFDNNFVVLAGLTFSFGESKQKEAPIEKIVTQETAPVVVDGDDDNDGILNSIDECPVTVAGTVVDAKGCKVDGDDDKDGVLNSIDTCPTTPTGLTVNAQGCQLDTDSDGIVDANDACQNTPLNTSVNSDGCPQTVKLDINFENNSAKIKTESDSKIQVYADFLIKNTNYDSKIIGYTDSRGKASYNQKLSEKRAQSVVDSLIAKGVNSQQLSSLGEGESNPIADNKTAEGRSKNRRIEAELTRN